MATPGERAVGEPVSANFFSALRVMAALGRVFESRDDSVLGGNRVAVLSHAFWTRRFQSSPAVLGRTILYKETPYTVVGVAQPGFTGIDPQTPIDIWVPITADADKAWLNNAHNSWLTSLWASLQAPIRHGCKPRWTWFSEPIGSAKSCRVCRRTFGGPSKASVLRCVLPVPGSRLLDGNTKSRCCC